MLVVRPFRKAGGFDHRTVRPFPDDDWWRALHRLADRRYAEVRNAFLNALQGLVGSVTIKSIREALEAGQVDLAFREIPWDRLSDELVPLRSILADIAEAGARQASLTMADELGIAGVFDLVNPRSVEWALQHTNLLIRDQLVPETVRAVQRVTLRSLTDGVAPDESARLIHDAIGLTERQANAVYNLQRKLVAGGTPIRDALRQAKAYSERLRAHRAMVAARTETINAAAAGQRNLWDNAVQEGFLDAAQWEREWVAILGDGRTCPICLALDNKRAPLGGRYPDGRLGPTAHAMCRCAERLVERTPES